MAAASAVTFPISLDYGEGIVVEQALLITGPMAYGDITTAPFIVFYYPPIYHLAVRAAGMLAGATDLAQLLPVARIVSVAAGIVAAGAVGWMCWRLSEAPAGRGWRLAAGLAAAFAAIANGPTAIWLPFARVDTLALAFTLGGLAVGAAGSGSRTSSAIAVLLFVLGVYTKQTSIAAPAAMVLVLLLADRRRAVEVIALGSVLGLMGLGIAHWLTDGGFLRHVIGYNVNRFYLSRLLMIPVVIAPYLPLLATALFGLSSRRGDARARGVPWLGAGMLADPLARGRAMVVVHFAICSAMLVLIGKSGSSINYVMEWLSSTALLAGLAVARTGSRIGTRGASLRSGPFGAAMVGSLLLAQAVSIPDPRSLRLDVGPASRAVADELVAMVRAADGAVISDDMVLVLRAGKRVLWEPAIFADLASMGRWDEQLIIERLRRGDVALAVTSGRRGSGLFDSRYNPAVASAMEAALPQTTALGWLIVHRPVAPRNR